MFSPLAYPLTPPDDTTMMAALLVPQITIDDIRASPHGPGSVQEIKDRVMTLTSTIGGMREAAVVALGGVAGGSNMSGPAAQPVLTDTRKLASAAAPALVSASQADLKGTNNFLCVIY